MSNETLVDFNPENLFGAEEAAAEETAAPAENLSDFEQMIMEGTREESRSRDANLPRYGVAVLQPVRLFGHGANFYVGDFNVKHADRSKGNRVNTAYFPRFELMPFTTKTYPIPFEGKAQLLTEEEADEEMRNLESFDVSTVESTLKNSRRNAPITAEKWSLQMYDKFKGEGFTLLEALRGVESYEEARRLFRAVLTEEKIMRRCPVTGLVDGKRERLGFSLSAPFILETVSYLENFARDEYRKEARGQDDLEKMEKIRLALLQAARVAQNYCEKTLSDTEALIARKEKRGYDLPDYVHRNAPPPRDLVAMIHLNRYPKDMEALRIAETTGAAVAAAAGNLPAISAPAPDTIPRDEVQKMLDERDRTWEQKFDETLKGLRQEFQTASGNAPETPETPASKQPAKQKSAAKAEDETQK